MGWLAFDHQRLAVGGLEINSSAAGNPIVSPRKGTSVSSALTTTMLPAISGDPCSSQCGHASANVAEVRAPVAAGEADVLMGGK